MSLEARLFWLTCPFVESGGSLGEHAEEEKCALQSHLFGERLELYKTIVRDGGADACRGKLSLMSYIFI